MKKNRAWKSLLFKVSHLDLEYQDRQELLDQFRIDFDKLVCKEVGPDFYKSKYEESSSTDLVKSNTELNDLPENSSEENSEENSEDDSENIIEKTETLESINKIWKLVALKTHPDRNKNNSDLTTHYISASNAYKEKAYGKLLIIALELGILIPEDDKLIPYIKENISSLEQKISHIETLALWKWINAEDKEKDLIVNFTAEIVKARNLQKQS